MRLHEIMSTPVVTLRAESPVSEAAALLVEAGFGAAPVVDGNGALVGIADEADLVRGRVVPDGWQVEGPPEALVAEVMCREVVTGGPDEDVADIVATMLDRHIRSVPVIVGGRPVGIVSRRDVLRAVAHRGLLDDRVDLVSHDRGAP